jgi:aspartyl protease family protein
MRTIGKLLVVFTLLSAPAISAADMVVQGLFKGAVLLKSGTEQKLVKVGQSWQGITVIEADAKAAVVEINGERQTVTVSRHIASSYTQAPEKRVRLRKNENLQYITNAQINGRATQVLVDTGANIVALSSNTARQLGIDYSKGTPTQVQTASGIATAYSIVLNEVSVGEITVNHVQASVVEGLYPEIVLLGMTYLQHVEMQEKDGVLMLIGKF